MCAYLLNSRRNAGVRERRARRCESMRWCAQRRRVALPATLATISPPSSARPKRSTGWESALVGRFGRQSLSSSSVSGSSSSFSPSVVPASVALSSVARGLASPLAKETVSSPSIACSMSSRTTLAASAATIGSISSSLSMYSNAASTAFAFCSAAVRHRYGGSGGGDGQDSPK